MGTIAEKLTYLNTTKEKIRDSINLTGANLTSEDTFRSYASKLKKGYIDIINNGIDTLYNNFPKVSGIGSNLSLTPTYEAPMKLNEIQGNTLQDSQPTPDSPVEIQSVTGLQNVTICGKNLFNKDSANIIQNKYLNSSGVETSDNSFSISDYMEVKSNTTYSSQPYENKSACICFYDSNKTYLSSVALLNVNPNFTTPNNCKYIRTSIWNEDINLIQINEGSTATDYEPYKGNTYEVNLGKNLIPNNITSQTLNGLTITKNDDSSVTIDGTCNYLTTLNMIPNNITMPKGQYTLSGCPSGGGANTWRIDINNGAVAEQRDEGNGATFTLNQDTVFQNVRIRIANGAVVNNLTFKPMLEKGTQATSYSPYFTPIELNKIGTYQDRIYKDNGKWYVEKQIGKVVLNGSENWSTHQFGTNSFQLSFPDVKSGGDYITILSSHFKGIPYTNRNTGNNIIYNDAQSSISLIIRNTGFATLNDFKTWLSSNNVTLEYVLATPEYTEITNTELIEDLETLYTAKSQEGTTNISITSEDLEMILNVSALKGE